ncbi:hypothetical protein EVY06_01980 [Citrobacter koseri]|uniref:Uncharacterized protein n=1 Tax=Citrobacter koseri TaxID=545 RepID=A0AAQ0VCF5_CITKO|nr:hypothetical protein EGX86_15355 [Citrobacter koseri]QCQ71177.1 hypothetical protein FD428_09285 [Citrobacter sp. TBCP-5362]MBE0023779.1 hypothetical protein [Citrobacter koseri]MBE0082909.1 hypothetical protein [Citrobacter koseri]PWY11378.1 hypothetical protein DL345_18000 [Citrobacter koseri]
MTFATLIGCLKTKEQRHATKSHPYSAHHDAAWRHPCR